MSGHSERKHALLSASARARWRVCGYSVQAGAALPEPPSSEAAAEGTRRHEWLEWMLRKGFDLASDYVCDNDDIYFTSLVAEGAPKYRLTADGAAAIQQAINLAAELMEPRQDTELYVETVFKFPGMDPDLGGTGDICIINRARGSLDIVDFKNGGHPVEALDSPQCGQYAVGAKLRFPDVRFRKIRIHIVQPKDGPSKLWEMDGVDLFDEQQILKADAARARVPATAGVPGPHCTFCKVGYHQKCDARRKLVEAEAAKGFAPVTDRSELTRLAGLLPVIEKYAEDLKAYLHNEIRAGRADFGKKLVAFQNRRAWAKDKPALAVDTILKRRHPELNVWVPAELRSPADIKKEIGLLAFNQAFGDELNAYVVKTTFGVQLVDNSDERPAIQNAASGFEPVK